MINYVRVGCIIFAVSALIMLIVQCFHCSEPSVICVSPWTWWYDLSESDQASWMEAIGGLGASLTALIALFVAVGVPVYQRHLDRQETLARNRKQILTFVLRLSDVLDGVKTRWYFSEALSNADDQEEFKKAITWAGLLSEDARATLNFVWEQQPLFDEVTAAQIRETIGLILRFEKSCIRSVAMLETTLSNRRRQLMAHAHQQESDELSTSVSKLYCLLEPYGAPPRTWVQGTTDD